MSDFLVCSLTPRHNLCCVRFTPCSYRGVEERLPHGSMSRLTDHSRHSSSHRLNEQSRHSSIRDLSNNPMTHITHGTSMNRVIEEDGTSAWLVLSSMGNLCCLKSRFSSLPLHDWLLKLSWPRCFQSGADCIRWKGKCCFSIASSFKHQSLQNTKNYIILSPHK